MRKLNIHMAAALLALALVFASCAAAFAVDTDYSGELDPETYELEPIDESMLTDSFKFVTENMTCTVSSYKGKVFAVEPPNFVELTVTETDPGFAGNTATNVTKPATLETGAEIKVPLFINPGDRIRIDTRTGEYMERAK